MKTEMMKAHLPPDILIEVFSRIPTKSVGACRCLSKFWNNYLSSKEFIKIHLNHYTNFNQESLILISRSRSLHLITPPLKDDVFSKVIELQNVILAAQNDAVSPSNGIGNNWYLVVGSCNGLVLLFSYPAIMSVVNPVTQQKVNIPCSPSRQNICFTMCGFGYDRSSDDYKIVLFLVYESDGDQVVTFISVYSLKTGLWKEVGVSPYDHIPPLSVCPYVNGAIHFMGRSKEPCRKFLIVAFDLAKEVFVRIPAPIAINEATFDRNYLYVVGGYLCMVDLYSSNDKNYLWIMKRYGVRESWTKVSVNTGDWSVPRVIPLCFTKNEEEMIFATPEEDFGCHYIFGMFNIKDGTRKNMFVDGILASFLDGGTFVDSLVSPS